jgi:FkbM family methyltransferase
MLRTLDAKLHIFRILKEMPHARVRTAFLRKYYGRLRKYTSVDLESVLAGLPDRLVAVDLGANQGSFTQQVLGRADEIHAVEPDPLVFEKLQATFATQPNVKLYNAAIGGKDGEISFYRQSEFDESDPLRNSVSSSVFSDHRGVNAARAITVPQIGIVRFLEKIGKHVDLMKVDIEGAEVPFLETLFDSVLLNRISVILVETHEHALPQLVDRTDALRQRAKQFARPKIDMNWH